jgi:hypothetical protein
MFDNNIYIEVNIYDHQINRGKQILIQLDATYGIDGSDYMELIINIYVYRYNNYYLVKLHQK